MNTSNPRSSTSTRDPPGLRRLHSNARAPEEEHGGIVRKDSKQMVEDMIAEDLKSSNTRDITFSRRKAQVAPSIQNEDKQDKISVLSSDALQSSPPQLETVSSFDEEAAAGYGIVSEQGISTTRTEKDSLFPWILQGQGEGKNSRLGRAKQIGPRGVAAFQHAPTIATIQEEENETTSENEEAADESQDNDSSEAPHHEPGAFAIRDGHVHRRSRRWSWPRQNQDASFPASQSNHDELSQQLSMRVAPPIEAHVAAVPNWEERFDALQAQIESINHGSSVAETSIIPILPVENVEPATGDEVFHNEYPGERDSDWLKHNKYMDSFKQAKKSRDCRLACLAFVLILIGAIVVSVKWTTKESDPSSSDNVPTPSPFGSITQAPSTAFPTTSFFPTNSPTETNPWQPLGEVLNGKEARDYAGSAVALSHDASVLAIGAPQVATTTSLPGYVLVFKWNGQSWTPMGQELVGDANDDHFGVSVALNEAGNVLAVGAPRNGANATKGDDGKGLVRVYEYNVNASTWVELGTGVRGQAVSEKLGWSVSLSGNGDTLAVGALGRSLNGKDSGAVQVFKYDRAFDAWEQLGQELHGQSVESGFGQGVSLSASGFIMAVGHVRFDATTAGEDAGRVVVYEYNTTTFSWEPLGDPIVGREPGEWFGWSVTLDDVGTVLATGSRRSSLGGANSGSVSIFDFDNATFSWIQRGRTLIGDAAGDEFGSSISLNRQGGTVVAIGSRFHDGFDTNAGAVQIFEYTDTKDWIQVGFDIFGAGAGEQSGRAVSLSGNGTIVAIGDRIHNGRTGYVRVYSLTS